MAARRECMTGSQLAMRQQAARAVGRTDSRVCVDRRAPTGAREVLAKRHRRSGPEPSPRAQRGMTDSQRWCSGWWWAQSSFLGDAGRWGGCKIGVLGECLGSWAERWLRRRRAALQAHTRSPLPRRLPGAPEGGSSHHRSEPSAVGTCCSSPSRFPRHHPPFPQLLGARGASRGAS